MYGEGGVLVWSGLVWFKRGRGEAGGPDLSFVGAGWRSLSLVLSALSVGSSSLQTHVTRDNQYKTEMNKATDFIPFSFPAAVIPSRLHNVARLRSPPVPRSVNSASCTESGRTRGGGFPGPRPNSRQYSPPPPPPLTQFSEIHHLPRLVYASSNEKDSMNRRWRGVFQKTDPPLSLDSCNTYASLI